MLTVGLTGGIGSGKSSVARLLALRGAVVIDADVIARDIVQPGEPTLQRVVERFGAEILLPDGHLNRGALAAVVFNDSDALADLNAIMHPVIAQRSRELERQAPAGSVIVHDSPLLVEQGLDHAYDVVVVVDCPDDVRLDRLVNQRGMAADDARARMAAQASRDERLAVADYVIDNSGRERDLEPLVDAVWSELHLAASEQRVDDLNI